MRHASLPAFLSSHRGALAKGPVALLLAEDGVEVASSLRHALGTGFRAAVLLADTAQPLPPEADRPGVHAVTHPLLAEGAARRPSTPACAPPPAPG